MSKPTLTISPSFTPPGFPTSGPQVVLTIPTPAFKSIESVAIYMTPAEAAETAHGLLALAEDCVNADRAERRS